jgi:hypothetical protein
MVETIFTKHPQKGTSGKEISKEKYDMVRIAITESLAIKFPLTEDQLVHEVEIRLAKTPFPGEVAWYVHTVRLDLEARRIIQRVTEGKKETFLLWPELPI